MNKVIVIGASGYIGSQFVPELIRKGYAVRAAARSLAKMKIFKWSIHRSVELMEVDVLLKDSIEKACRGCDAVYYLVHSMNRQNKDFEETDRQAARNMADAAAAAGVKRIIYLGGLGDDKTKLSKHLRSRMEVSEILHAGKVPVTTLRAAMIIGKGSISFEILKHLVNRLPIMITPRWVATESQPIAVSNVLNYLIGCLDAEATADQTFDIGGADVVTYRHLMDIYAEESGAVKRMIIPVPFLTPTLSSYWIGLVTPYPSYIARPLTEGLRNRVVCRDTRIKNIIPQRLLSCREAIHVALRSSSL